MKHRRQNDLLEGLRSLELLGASMWFRNTEAKMKKQIIKRKAESL